MRQADWIDIDDDAPARAKRRPWVLIIAATPWILVIALLVIPGRSEGPTDAGAGSHDNIEAAQSNADEPHDADHARNHDAEVPPDAGADGNPDPGAGPEGGTDSATHGAGDRPGEADASGDSQQPDANSPATDPPNDDEQSVHIGEMRGNWRIEPGVEEAAALAIVAARAWLTGLEPVFDNLPNGNGEGYAEHLVVEAVERPASDAAVVTVVGVMLDGEDQSPSVQRLAVPIVFADNGPQPGGAPWMLPAPSLELAELARTEHDDPDAAIAAAEALDDAGLGELVALYETDGWPVIAEVGGDGEHDTTDVWLRPHLDGFVVAGTTLSPPARESDERASASDRATD